jgi:phosphoribosylpyrophosphate synthetase
LAGHFAQALGGDLATLNEVRTAESEVNVTSVIGDVQEKVAVMIDDMIDTAGTVVAGAAALREAGAATVYACATNEGSVRYLVTGSAAAMLHGRQDDGRGPCTGCGASRRLLTS